MIDRSVIGEIDGYPVKAQLNMYATEYDLELSAGYDIWGVSDSVTGESRDICKCICHKNGFLYFISIFVIAFWRTLNSNIRCVCGYQHYH